MTDEQKIDLEWLDAESAGFELAKDEWHLTTLTVDKAKSSIAEIREALKEIETEAILNGEGQGSNEKARQAALDSFMLGHEGAASMRLEMRHISREIDDASASGEAAEKTMKLHERRIEFGTAWLRSQPITVTGPDRWPDLQVAGFAVTVGATTQEEGKTA